MNTKSIFSLLILSALLAGCASIARELIMPNQCQKCQVIDPNGVVVWEDEGCGGDVSGMEDQCKITAYDYGCGYICSCETYRQDPEEGEE